MRGRKDAKEQRLYALLRGVHWCPAFAPGEFRETCRRWPKGYGVQASEHLHGRRPRHRLFAFKNPVCAWLRPDVVDPKGWMVYEAQLKDLFHFSQWQARARGLKPGDPAAHLPKDLLAAWDDPVLPPEYYEMFPADYLQWGMRHFMHVHTISLPGYPWTRFELELDDQGLGTTLTEYILYLTHRFHVLARGVRRTQPAADRAFAKVVASGILNDEHGTPPPSQEHRDAVVRTYLEETEEWREANLEVIPVWYRERWIGGRIVKLTKYAMVEGWRRKRESGKSYNSVNNSVSVSDSDSDVPVKVSTAKGMRRAFGILDACMAEEAATAKAKKARGMESSQGGGR